ncbi:MAG TPA: hypothetical protein VKB67_03000 [Rhizomicrobium sp.]|nr:hypothetical protein [Rhizomicrobium sp.]
MNQLKRRTFLAGLAASAAAPSLAAESDLPLSEIIARHTKARGGAAALDAVQTMAADLEIVEKGQVVSARYRCNKSPAYRIDIFDHGKHVFCEGLDRNGPWLWPGDQPKPRQGVPEGKASGLTGIQFNLYGLHAFPRLGHKLSLDGRESLSGVNYYVVRLDLKGGYPTFLYIDPESWMIARRRDFRANHPDLNPVKQHLETQFDDFRVTDGVMSAFLEHQVDLDSGKINQVIITDSTTYNPKLDAKIFDRSYKAA